MGPLLWPRCRLKRLGLWLLHDGDVVLVACCFCFVLRTESKKKKTIDEYPLPDAHHFGPDSAAVHAQWTYANGHKGTKQNTHGRRA